MKATKSTKAEAIRGLMGDLATLFLNPFGLLFGMAELARRDEAERAAEDEDRARRAAGRRRYAARRRVYRDGGFAAYRDA